MWKVPNLAPVTDKAARTTRRDPKAAAAKGADPFVYGPAAPRPQYRASERTLKLAQPRTTRVKFEVVPGDKTRGGRAPHVLTRTERAPQAAATAEVRHKASERIMRLAQPRGVPATKFATAATTTAKISQTAATKSVRAAGGSLNHAVSDRILALSKPRVRGERRV